MRRTPYLLLVAMTMVLSASICSCSEDPEEKEKKEQEQDKSVEDWENIDMNGDATLAPRMLFNVGDTIQVEGTVTTRATYTIIDEVEKCLLDENDIVTIEVSAGTGSTRSTAKKNYKVNSNHTDLTYYEGTPSLNEFHWDYGTEKINIRAWSYGGTVADDATPITDPDGQTISVELNQKDNGYKELLYSPQQTDISFSTGKSGISLPLYHQMARVVVTLSKKASDDDATVSSVTIGDGTAEIPTSGKYHKPTSGNYGTWDNITKTAAATIRMKVDDAENGKYSAVVIPTNYPQDLKFIYVTMSDGNKYAYTISDAAGITLSAGNQYNFTISIGDDVATLQATYPTEWSSSDFPITNYTTSERFGMYAVNPSTGELVYSNEPMTIASISGTTATLSASSSIAKKLSTHYNYYIYYPYRTSPGTVTTSGETAADFFAGVISGWSTAANQSTTDALRENDLQIGKITGDGLKNHTLTAATMAHKAGLAVMTLGSKTVPTVQYHNASGTLLDGNIDGTTTIYASSTFSTNIPYVNSSTKKCYAIIRESGCSYKGTGQDEWTVAYTTPTVTAGTVYTHTATTTKRTFIKKGWVYDYAINNNYSLQIPQDGSYKLEVWGAQGGSNSTLGTAVGGKGGYSYGNKTMNKGSYFYICVGGAGIACPGFNTNRAAGGYNGGGHCVNTTADARSSGGGCTHIATTSNLGQLRNYVDNKSYVLIVAGGGGGGACHTSNGAHDGGSGGGTSGGDGVYWNPSARPAGDGIGGPSDGNYVEHTLQVVQGGFGYGGNYYEDLNSAVNNTGGGAGYWGGNSGHSSAPGGGGGSGYIGGVTSGSTTNGVREGNGYARITTNFEWVF